VAGFVVLVVLAGAGYSIWLTNTSGSPPALPVAPPHAVALWRHTETDMLQGNFVLQTALYRSSETPVQLIHFYRNELSGYTHQVGGFLEQGDTILQSKAPEALQNLPAALAIGDKNDPYAASYLYTEYSTDQSDVGIAIDTRNPTGPTLVYQEMLTQPN
jgi:hypothetical protein